MNFFDKIKIFQHYNLLFGIGILTLLFVYIFISALYFAHNITFFPMDGDFQNYNVLRRLDDGQLFAKDFNSYLGIGSMYFLYFFYLLDGANGLSSSIFASHLVTSILFVFDGLLIFRLFRVDFFISTIVMFILYFYALNNIYDANSLNLYTILLPYNSIYGLRMALPFIFGLILYLILPTSLSLSRKEKYLFAVVSGISLLWSNDYSIPVYIFACLLFLLITLKTSINKVQDFLYFITISMLTFITFITIITGFEPLSWYSYNFLGIAKDQYWYYLGRVIFEPDEIPFHLYILAEIFFALWILTKKDKLNYILSFVILSSIASGYLTQIGGRESDRYFLQSFLLLYLLPIGALLSYLSRLSYRMAVIFFIFFILIGSTYINYQVESKGLTSIRQNYYSEPILKANLDPNYMQAVEIAKILKKDTEDLKPEQKMFSEYSTLMDSIVGVYQSSGDDYIIHALGDDERKSYIKKFKDTNPKYVSTIRDDFSYWELWSKRTNWWFYRELFNSDYYPKYSTHYNIVWAKNQNANQYINNENISCSIAKVSSTNTDLIFDTASLKKDFVADVEIEYDVDFNKTIYPIIGSRFLISVDDLFYNKQKLENRSNYLISPYLRKQNLMLQHFASDGNNILKISAFPIERTSLKIKSCKAKIIRYWNENEEIDKIERNEFTPFNFNDNNWGKGISIMSRNGFVIKNKSNQVLKIGDKLKFSTGIREINEIELSGEYTRIFLSGKRLNPVDDGFPHKIFLIEDVR